MKSPMDEAGKALKRKLLYGAALLGWFGALVFLILFLQKPQGTIIPLSEAAPISPPAQTETAAVESQEKAIGKAPVREKAVVTRVIDGDTVELDNGERLRLIGIDTPERGRPYFEEAKAKLTELVEGRQVELEKDLSERDRYGRLLRYIWLGGVFINVEMVQLGYANSYTYPPDVKYQEEILAAEREARERQLGLWAPTLLTASGDARYVASRLREPFHYSWCKWAQKISESNKERFRTREEALQAGHRPCKVCNP